MPPRAALAARGEHDGVVEATALVAFPLPILAPVRDPSRLPGTRAGLCEYVGLLPAG
ncbi:hypothetical protein [Streptomyces sp. NPDC058330]|uniref:hypothetical protein n=1 Tax=Streptomyces sp. NPDC058330 TaxID=3346449 RepID=UPI0036EC4F61